jgi:hypothetical protein
MAKDKWIGGAVKRPGSLTKAAKKHGRSTLAEAKVEAKSDNRKIASRGRLALRFMGKAKHGNLKKATGKKKTTHKRVSKS